MTKDEIIKEIIRCNRILTTTENPYVKRDYTKYKRKLENQLKNYESENKRD